MGGSGSGRTAEKDTVEDYKSIDINFLKRKEYIKDRCHTSGSLIWSSDGEIVSSISFVARLDLNPPFIRLYYTYNDDEKIDYHVSLTTTYPYFGGKRFWFICPGQRCGQRVGKLYLAGRYFLCRHCCDLTYQSCQDSHKFDSLYAFMGAELGIPTSEVKKAFNSKGWL